MGWGEVYNYGYAVMGLLPNQLYSLEISDFLDMYYAFIHKENVEFDKDMSKLAWQTAILMNTSGRYKKHIKPTDLYTSMFNKESTASKPKKTKKELREELKDTFNI